jgi:hypothetical protein
MAIRITTIVTARLQTSLTEVSGDIRRVTVSMRPQEQRQDTRDPQEHIYIRKELYLLSSLLSFRF